MLSKLHTFKTQHDVTYSCPSFQKSLLKTTQCHLSYTNLCRSPKLGSLYTYRFVKKNTDLFRLMSQMAFLHLMTPTDTPATSAASISGLCVASEPRGALTRILNYDEPLVFFTLSVVLVFMSFMSFNIHRFLAKCTHWNFKYSCSLLILFCLLNLCCVVCPLNNICTWILPFFNPPYSYAP